MLSQHQLNLSKVPQTARLGVGKSLGKDTARTADLNSSRRYSLTYGIYSDIKAKKRGDVYYLWCFPSRTSAVCAEARLSGKWTGITCWSEVLNKTFLHSSFVIAKCLCIYLKVRGVLPSYFLPHSSQEGQW